MYTAVVVIKKSVDKLPGLTAYLARALTQRTGVECAAVGFSINVSVQAHHRDSQNALGVGAAAWQVSGSCQGAGIWTGEHWNPLGPDEWVKFDGRCWHETPP